MTSSKRGVIAVCQVTATNNKEENFQVCKDLAHRAKYFNVQVFFVTISFMDVIILKIMTFKLHFMKIRGCLPLF